MTVANQVDLIEIFNVTVFASSSIIGTQTLAVDGEQSANLTFTWNTTGVMKGNYTSHSRSGSQRNKHRK